MKKGLCSISVPGGKKNLANSVVYSNNCYSQMDSQAIGTLNHREIQLNNNSPRFLLKTVSFIKFLTLTPLSTYVQLCSFIRFQMCSRECSILTNTSDKLPREILLSGSKSPRKKMSTYRGERHG